jgi:hypothetical protein
MIIFCISRLGLSPLYYKAGDYFLIFEGVIDILLKVLYFR